MIDLTYLHDYQRDLIEGSRELLRQGHRQHIIQSPAGSGKTVTGAYIMQQAASKGVTCLFVVPRTELLRQTSKALHGFGIRHGVVSPSRPMTRGQRVYVAMAKTLANRISKGASLPDVGLIIYDEGHGSVAPTYDAIFERWPDAVHLCLSATPGRTDDIPLSKRYTAMVHGPSVRDLIARGNLSDYRMYRPAIAQLANITGGNLDRESAERLDKAVIGDAVEHYRRLCNGKRTVVVTPSVKKAEEVAADYRAAGIRAATIEGSMPDRERQQVLDDLRAHRVDVVTSCDLLVEGVDIPEIEVVQWLRRTSSLRVWIQACGRSQRVHAGKEHAIILDHVNNSGRLGLPCEDFEWSLDVEPKRKTINVDDVVVPSTVRCEQCFRTYAGNAYVCPHCGADNTELRRAKQRREQEVIDAELVEVKKQQAIAERRAQARAGSIEELVEVYARGNGSNPAARAAIVYAARQGRKPRPDEFNAAKRHLSALRGGLL